MCTTSSFSAASLRGLGSQAICEPEIAAIISARSRTRWVSVIWLKISTRLPRAGGFFSASSMQRTESWMWMKARVWPPVPCTVRG
ncbi:hypothetical protein D3C87_1673340 [compost metagenome]